MTRAHIDAARADFDSGLVHFEVDETGEPGDAVEALAALLIGIYRRQKTVSAEVKETFPPLQHLTGNKL